MHIGLDHQTIVICFVTQKLSWLDLGLDIGFNVSFLQIVLGFFSKAVLVFVKTNQERYDCDSKWSYSVNTPKIYLRMCCLPHHSLFCWYVCVRV